MAGDWIKMRIALAEDPAVIAMAARLGESEFTIVGRLHHLWGWADVQSRDGHAPGVTHVWIDRYVQRDGFAKAMVAVDWLVIDEFGVSFPNFSRHNGESAKQRGLAAERKRNQREKVTQEAGQMSRVQRDQSVTREEKNREEVNHYHPAVGGIVGSDSVLEENQIETAATKTTRAKRMNGAKVPLPADTLECPVQKIIDGYHAAMPDNPSVKVLNAARRKAITARWREASRLPCKPFGCYATEEAGITAWNKFFSVCAQSEFLTGRAPPQPGRPPFVADIDFLMSPDGFAKCLENKYHRGAS